ncbi:MAG TPA: PA containing protein [Pseudonocardiaceae bacterium]|nr:PA containing protein [Pseudonocardiaceae bacterium]
MLVRAAEIRDSEQQQIFDALDEIHARLAPLESLGPVRKRLSEMPDRTEISVLAERLDETLSKLEAQDSAIVALGRVVESIVDKLAKPFAELGGRLDGVAGRFEGVAGRMDGLEDRIAGLHKRIDDLDHHLERQDARFEALPAAVHGPVREQLVSLETGVRGQLDDAGKNAQDSMTSLTERLDALASRLTSLEQSVAQRPDADTLFGFVRKANEESEQRHTTQLDEAMATFAELIMGAAPPPMPTAPPPPPRPAQRRTRRQAKPADADTDAAAEAAG